MEINRFLLILIAWKVNNTRPDYVPQLTAIFQINITNFRFLWREAWKLLSSGLWR